MKTKTARNTSIAVIILLIIAVTYWFYPKPVTTSTTSEVTIVEKGEDKGSHWVRGYDPNSEKKETIKMHVEKEKIWDSLQENETYMLTYIKEKNETRIEEIVGSK